MAAPPVQKSSAPDNILIPDVPDPKDLVFFVVGDAGQSNEAVRRTARAMADRARLLRSRLDSPSPESPAGGNGLAFVLLCGDNFYPNGIQDGQGVKSPLFRETWAEPFNLCGEEEDGTAKTDRESQLGLSTDDVLQLLARAERKFNKSWKRKVQ
jgi:hypothetical protein